MKQSLRSFHYLFLKSYPILQWQKVLRNERITREWKNGTDKQNDSWTRRCSKSKHSNDGDTAWKGGPTPKL